MFRAYKYYWQNTFKYRSRSTRADFWWPVLVNAIIFFVLGIVIAAALGSVTYNLLTGYLHIGVGAMLLIAIAIIFAVATIFPSVSLLVRRFRDTGLSGWLVLGFWLLSIIFTSDNSFIQSIGFALGVIEVVICCLPSSYVNRQGWWSPNYSDDIAVATLGQAVHDKEAEEIEKN